MESTERSLLAMLDDDLRVRDAGYEPGMLLEGSFAEGLSQAHEREWAMLGQ